MRFATKVACGLGLSTFLAGVSARTAANGEHIQDDLSFGQHGDVWTPDHHHIAGFSLSGEHDHLPEIFSDRLVLTPPWPGNRRAAIWADHPENDDEWSVDMEFRVSGPERGSGNMQVWYVKDKHEVGTSSIYTVGKWDGLGIVIDQHGGHGGSIRGFLNDHAISYKDHHQVDHLSFASCYFAYRNLGRFVHLEVKQTKHSFEVNVDGHQCFKTHKIHVPKDYHFGLTAASSDSPDSFEVRSFLTRGLTGSAPAAHDAETHHDANWHDQTGTHYEAATHHEPDTHHGHDTHYEHDTHHDPHKSTEKHTENPHDWYWTEEKENIPDAPADHFKTEADRFNDLHDRISLLGHQLNILFHDLSTFKEQSEERHRDLVHWLSPTHDGAEAAKHAAERIEHVVYAIQKEIEGKDYRAHLETLAHVIAEGHAALPHTVHSLVQSSHPRIGFFAFLIIVSQVMLLGSYIIYRRRRDGAPKKYL